MKKIFLILLLLPAFAQGQNDPWQTKKYYKYAGQYLRLTVGNSIGFQVDSTGKIIRYNNTTPPSNSILLGNGSGLVLSTGGAGQHLTGGGWKDTLVALTLSEGSYTPTLTNTTNVSASTAYACQWFRVGDRVTVAGTVDIDPTATGAVELRLSLPVVPSFSDALQAGGAANSDAVAGESAAIYSVTSTGLVAIKFIAVDITNKKYSFTFTYKYTAP